MIIVVSGTHGSGKTSLVDAFAAAYPEVTALPDPIEALDDYPIEPGAGTFFQQLQVAAARLNDAAGTSVIAERGPLDLLAYLEALDRLGRPTASPDHLRRGIELCSEAMQHVDLVVLLPLDARSPITVPPDEDPELREVGRRASNAASRTPPLRTKRSRRSLEASRARKPSSRYS